MADVTKKNPNVNYELGLCHALGVPTIIITKDIDDVPFDYRHRRCITYDTQEAGWDDKLISDLSKTIQVVTVDTSRPDELEWPYDTNALSQTSLGSALIASGDARITVIRGAQIVRDAITTAFGPHGEAVSVSRRFGATLPLWRGSQIAQGIRSTNPLEEKGIEEMRNIASSVHNSVGDGSKLAMILAAGLMAKGQELTDKGHHRRMVLETFQSAIDRVSGYLLDAARRADPSSLSHVASTAAHGDKRVGELVTQAIKDVGPDGVIAVESSNGTQSSLQILEGMRLDRGFLSDYFITDADRQECVLENCLVLVHEKKIASMRDLLPVLEEVARSGKSLLVIAENVEGEALSTLVLNQRRGTISCVAVRSPAYADRRKHLIDDIAVLTGARALTAELGLSLSSVTMSDLGTAERVIVTRDETAIIGGGGSSQNIAERAQMIRNQISNTASAIEQEKLQERLAMLVGGLAVLRAGGLTEADVAEQRYRLESALRSARAAIEQGCLPGGGAALFRAGMELQGWEAGSELEQSVRQSITSVLEEPIRQLIENAGRSPIQMLADIKKSSSPTLGFNAESGRIEDLEEAGVVDPVQTIDLALRVALSHSRAVLQTGTWDMSTPTN